MKTMCQALLAGLVQTQKMAYLPLGALMLALGTAQLTAQSTVTVYFDEFGTASIWTNAAPPMTALSSSVIPDPSGGLPGYNVLVYSLGFTNMPGDVLVQDPTYPGDPILDVLRFLADGQLIVYSDDLNGISSPADTPGMPNPLLPNILFTTKDYVSSTLATAIWTPNSSQPGYNPGFSQLTYNFFDPGTASIPEPATNGLLGVVAGISVLVGMLRRARKPSAPQGSNGSQTVHPANCDQEK
jgi:hypothetical protein